MAALINRIATDSRAIVDFDHRRLCWIVVQGGVERAACVLLTNAQAEAAAWERTGRWS